jgi:hypothetical protein
MKPRNPEDAKTTNPKGEEMSLDKHSLGDGAPHSRVYQPSDLYL